MASFYELYAVDGNLGAGDPNSHPSERAVHVEWILTARLN